MPPVSRRWLYLAAAALLAIALIGLNRAVKGVAHQRVAISNGIPAVVYEPGPQRPFAAPPPEGVKWPVLVLAHGFTGNTGMMSQLGRRLARAGYAVITFDFEGHGENPHPFGRSGRLGLRADLDAVLLYARTQPHYDPERIAIAGHSMGGFAVVDYASRDPGVSAVIGISGGAIPSGPYTPPNTLLIFASGDPEFLRDASREAGAHFAGLDRVVLDRTYGDASRGTAVRVSEVEGLDHITILYSTETARRMAEWLGATLGPGAAPEELSDGRVLWSGLAFLAFLVVFCALVDALAPLLPRSELPVLPHPWRALGMLLASQVGAALLLAGVDTLGSSGPFGFVPLVVGGELLGFYALGGLLLALPLARRGALPARGLRDLRVWAGAAALLGFSYLVLGTIAQPFASLWLAPHRLGPAGLGFVLSLPLFAGLEWSLRSGDRTGVWAPLLGKLAVLVVIALSVMAGLLPSVLLLALGAFALIFALLELFCWRLSRAAPNPWIAALLQALWTGWITGAIFPVIAA